MKRRTGLKRTLVWLWVWAAPALGAAVPTAEELGKIEAAAPASAPAQPVKPRRVLVCDRCQGFKHTCIPYWNAALRALGRKSGAFEAVISRDPNVFLPDRLAAFDAVCFNNTTKLTFTAAQRAGLMDFVKGGKGIIGIHAAADNFDDWPEAAEMIGNRFSGHPWTANGTWAVRLDDPEHPLLKSFEGKGFKINDEIYRTRPPFYGRDKQRVLASVDLSDPATGGVKGVEAADADTGICWIRSYGKGRVFYCGFGHVEALTWDARMLGHVLAGIQFALGDLKADAAPLAGEPAGPATRAASAPQPAPDFEELLAPVRTYQYGQRREPLTKVQEVAAQSLQWPAAYRALLARDMAQMLESDATLDGKDFLCRQLALIGTPAEVPILARLLVQPETSDIARSALERIEGEAADQALTDALAKTSGSVRMGIISSLGQRARPGPEKALASLLMDPDQATAAGSAAALGYIGTAPAAEALSEARGKISAAVRPAVLEALLAVAEERAREGQKERAAAIYRSLYEAEGPETVRAGALRGLAGVEEPAQAEQRVVQALSGGQGLVQQQAITLVRGVSTGAAAQAAGKLGELGPAQQVQLLTALADRGEPAALGAVLAAMDSQDEGVSVAALEAVGALGGADEVVLLARRAAMGPESPRQAARGALSRLRGQGVDERIMQLLSDGSPALKVELIGALGRRNCTSAAGPLLQAARDADGKVRVEALRTLGLLAGPNQSGQLIGMIVAPVDPADRGELEKTVAAAAQRSGEPHQQTAAVLAALQKAGDVEVRCSLLRVLAGVRGQEALAALREALKSGEAVEQETAIKGLGQWNTAAPLEDVQRLAEGGANERQRILALRGYVRLIGLQSDRPAAQSVALYRKAMDWAPDAQEKKAVLAGLATVPDAAALETALAYLSDTALQEEAAAAVVAIATAVEQSDQAAAQAAAQKVLAVSRNDQTRQKAQQLTRMSRRGADPGRVR